MNSGRSGDTFTSDGITLVGRTYVSNQTANMGAHGDSGDRVNNSGSHGDLGHVAWPSRGTSRGQIDLNNQNN